MTAMKDKVGMRGDKAFLQIVLPLPPSDNHIYFNATTIKRGYKQSIRVLSDEAKKYKKAVASEIAELGIYNKVEFKKDVPYLCMMKVFFEDIENKGWATGKAQSRYKRVDTTNRNKLLIDSIMEAIGVDDSHIFAVVKFKRSDPDDSRVEVQVYELDIEEAEELEEETRDAMWRVLWG